MKYPTLLLALLLITGCATTSAPDATGPATRQAGRHAVIHEGPELVAAVGYLQAERSLGDDLLILAFELTSARGSGPIVVKRDDISIRTPDGRRLELLSDDEFRRNLVRIRVPVERSMTSLPLLYRVEQDQMPCDRWFFALPFGGIAFDEIAVNNFQACSGPMVFEVPGGIQPGRWRLVVELEESRADIPFVLEVRE